MTDLGEFLLARVAEDEADALRRIVIDPRVLAECDAKRRIVELHAPMEDITDIAYVTLRLLALSYSDHPDYDEAWRL